MSSLKQNFHRDSNHPSNHPLTHQQTHVLKFIENQILTHGRPPSLRDIARHFQYSAVKAAEDHVSALVKKGYLEKTPGKPCGLKLPHHVPAAQIPILGSVPAGPPLQETELRMGTLVVPLASLSLKNEDAHYALRVTGDSMIGAGILDGDFVVVHQQETAIHHDIVVAMIDGEVTVKRFDQKNRRLLAENPAYPPITLNPERDNRILGKVVLLHRIY